jgi:malate dehydrogenase (oxaloacetate-decarboxylating)
VACARLIFASGANPELCTMVDSRGILHRDRKDIELRRAEFVDKWRLCQLTNAEQRTGGIAEALKGADAVVALSTPGPDVLKKEWIAAMAPDAIVFACANPVPEIWPWEAKAAGAAVVATGRSDFSNQVNNSLGFPGIFRGALDVRARTITDEMCLAAAHALADMAVEKGLTPDYILPTMDEWDVFPREAAAVAAKAVAQGIARSPMSYDDEYQHAATIIRRARDMTKTMMAEGFIAEAE